MERRHYARLRCQPIKYIKRKVMMYPDPANTLSPSFYLTIDPGIVSFNPVEVPYYPQVGEVVMIAGKNNPVLVEQIYAKEHSMRGYNLKRAHVQGTTTNQ